MQRNHWDVATLIRIQAWRGVLDSRQDATFHGSPFCSYLCWKTQNATMFQSSKEVL